MIKQEDFYLALYYSGMSEIIIKTIVAAAAISQTTAKWKTKIS